MRTTLTIDEDVLQAAERLAKEDHSSLGEALSRLARKGLSQSKTTSRSFPTFEVPAGAAKLTLEMVKRAESDE